MSTERSTIVLNDLSVEVVRKDIKNLHLGVYPPKGRVRVAAPLAMSDDAVRLAVIGKLGWIRRQRATFEHQPRLPEPEAVSGESLYLFGQRYRLRVLVTDGRPKVTSRGKTWLDLHVRGSATDVERRAVLDRWYRSQLRSAMEPLTTQWEETLGVSAEFWGVKRMKTKWGSCNSADRRIWINSELAKKPVACLEYIVVHELVHLREPKHNDRFTALLDTHLPDWRQRRILLNSGPLSHENWTY